MTTSQQPQPISSPLPWIVVEFDYSPGGAYISAECQLGAHWGCSGGLKGDPKTANGGGGDWICHCKEESCPCHQTT